MSEGATRRAVEDIRRNIQSKTSAGIRGPGEQKIVKVPRFEVLLAKYIDPALIRKLEPPVTGPSGLVRYGRFESPSPKSPLKIRFMHRQWLKR